MNNDDVVTYYRYAIGLDLGQINDNSAVAVIKKTWSYDHFKKKTKTYHCGYLHRWPLGTKYITIIEDTKVLFNDMSFIGQVRANGTWRRFRPSLAIDETGVGRPVVEQVLAPPSPVNSYGILITGGAHHNRMKGRRGYHVPKKDLVGCVTRGLQGGSLTISKDLKEAPQMLKELKDFRAFVTPSRHEVLEHRSGTHDDLLLALAMALWISDYSPMPCMNPGKFWK